MAGGSGGQIARLRKEINKVTRNIYNRMLELSKNVSDNNKIITSLKKLRNDDKKNVQQAVMKLNQAKATISINERMIELLSGKIDSLQLDNQALRSRVDALELAPDKDFIVPEEE